MGKILDFNGKARVSDKPEVLYEKTRAWLDAMNSAVETRDPIAMRRASQAAGDLAGVMRLVQSKHIPVKAEVAPMLLGIDLMFEAGGRLAQAMTYSKPIARLLSVLLRDVEGEVRAQLAMLTGQDVPPRCALRDGEVNAACGVIAEAAPEARVSIGASYPAAAHVLHTYAWNLVDCLVVVVARSEEEARQHVRAKFPSGGVPYGFEETEPKVLGRGDVVWCFS